MDVLKGKKLMNHFFLDVIGNVAPKSIIHLPARSEIDPHAIKKQTTSSFLEVAATFAVWVFDPSTLLFSGTVPTD